jgi:predicted DCC family thiol-disulfide oxidoreductase YuxK
MTLDNVIVFDGVCNLCSISVLFIIKRDKRAVFRFAPVQSAAGADYLKQYDIDPASVRSILLVKDGQAYRKSAAALKIVKELYGPWRLMSIFTIVPRPIRDWFYDLIAKNRYKWFGKKDSCMVPTEDIKTRFLD